jgi:ribose transport system ATP-binding protein
MEQTPLIRAANITKRFPGTLALESVNFELAQGEIHSLCGENGAGKSTLMMIIAGVHQMDGGSLFFNGDKINFRDPHHAQQVGISTVFQELALSPNMSVAENVFTNSQPIGRLGLIKTEQMYRETSEALKKFGIHINPKTPLHIHSVAVQQIVEIARAVQRNAKVLILDEPTSAIGEREREHLFTVLRALRKNGVGIILVSHKLDEVFAISDRITVLKDGKFVGTLKTADTNQDEVVRMMVGRELNQLYPGKSKSSDDPLLELQSYSGPGFADVNLTVYNGEILGLFGLTGSGRTELARAIFGMVKSISGKLYLNGHLSNLKSARKAMQAGIAYITEDRKLDGLFLAMSIDRNIAAANLKALSGLYFMKRQKEIGLSLKSIESLNIKTGSIDQPVSGLSGGNQQKVLFAKWLARQPKLMIADEPTRGIDVGAKAEVHGLLRDLANNGTAVMMISSELPEIIGMCDRIAVMREGCLARIFNGDEATEENVGAIALGAANAVCET